MLSIVNIEKFNAANKGQKVGRRDSWKYPWPHTLDTVCMQKSLDSSFCTSLSFGKLIVRFPSRHNFHPFLYSVHIANNGLGAIKILFGGRT